MEYRQGSARPLLDQSLQALQSFASVAGSASAPARLARVLEIDRPTVILGSGQSDSDVDRVAAARARVEVARRSSGGGAVLVESGAVIWVDLIISADDPLWDSDVRRATWWVGEAWATALDGVGAGPARVWHGGMQRRNWDRRVCFAGLGPGEVSIPSRGVVGHSQSVVGHSQSVVGGSKKVVGIAQRRTRRAVLFQTAGLLRWEPADLVALLALEDAARAAATTELPDLAAGVGQERAGALTAALLGALPGPQATA